MSCSSATSAKLSENECDEKVTLSVLRKEVADVLLGLRVDVKKMKDSPSVAAKVVGATSSACFSHSQQQRQQQQGRFPSRPGPIRTGLPSHRFVPMATAPALGIDWAAAVQSASPSGSSSTRTASAAKRGSPPSATAAGIGSASDAAADVTSFLTSSARSHRKADEVQIRSSGARRTTTTGTSATTPGSSGPVLGSEVCTPRGYQPAEEHENEHGVEEQMVRTTEATAAKGKGWGAEMDSRRRIATPRGLRKTTTSTPTTSTSTTAAATPTVAAAASARRSWSSSGMVGNRSHVDPLREWRPIISKGANEQWANGHNTTSRNTTDTTVQGGLSSSTSSSLRVSDVIHASMAKERAIRDYLRRMMILSQGYDTPPSSTNAIHEHLLEDALYNGAAMGQLVVSIFSFAMQKRERNGLGGNGSMWQDDMVALAALPQYRLPRTVAQVRANYNAFLKVLREQRRDFFSFVPSELLNGGVNADTVYVSQDRRAVLDLYMHLISHSLPLPQEVPDHGLSHECPVDIDLIEMPLRPSTYASYEHYLCYHLTSQAALPDPDAYALPTDDCLVSGPISAKYLSPSPTAGITSGSSAAGTTPAGRGSVLFGAIQFVARVEPPKALFTPSVYPYITNGVVLLRLAAALHRTGQCRGLPSALSLGSWLNPKTESCCRENIASALSVLDDRFASAAGGGVEREHTAVERIYRGDRLFILHTLVHAMEKLSGSRWAPADQTTPRRRVPHVSERVSEYHHQPFLGPGARCSGSSELVDRQGAKDDDPHAGVSISPACWPHPTPRMRPPPATATAMNQEDNYDYSSVTPAGHRKVVSFACEDGEVPASAASATLLDGHHRRPRSNEQNAGRQLKGLQATPTVSVHAKTSDASSATPSLQHHSQEPQEDRRTSARELDTLRDWFIAALGPRFQYVAEDESFRIIGDQFSFSSPCLVFSDGVVLAHMIRILERRRCDVLDSVKPSCKRAAKRFNINRCLRFLQQERGMSFSLPLMDERLLEGDLEGVVSFLRSMRHSYYTCSV